MDIGRELAAVKKKLERIERQARLSHAAIDNTSVVVKDGTGSLRGIIGLQADGTTAVNIVNGPPPPQPSAPIVASVLGGVTVSWNGATADASPLPLDWARVEVHASIVAVYEPVPATLQGTIETAQGATVVVPCDAPVYVRLVARNTSGTASTASATVGPFGPTAVVADDIVDGIVTTLKLADDAVTQAKLAAGAVDSTALQDGAVLSAKLADAAVAVGKLADNAVTGPAIASGAVSAGKLAANSVVAGNIQAGAVTSASIAAGAVSTDKLTVTGGANLLTDPSFEGAYTASLVSGLTYASQDSTKGNGSPTSLKIDATSATATNRSVSITSVPVLPGDQLFIAADYWVSTDWAGTAVNVHIRWETAAGAILSYGIATSGASPTRGAWTRLTGTYTAPASAAVARLRIESSSGTAGTVWFDNAALRPVVAGTQIQDGAITTAKVVAGAIQTAQLDTGSVNADKIASGAVTTAKLDALAVTADKLAANAIIAGKIQAGAVDATALAADAITGKTITGGTINGTTITGGTMQTATSGERITLNEAGQNKVLVYNSSSVAINELSSRGLLVKGTTGAVLWLNPSATYPQLKLYNASSTNSAVLQASEPVTGDANVELVSGLFSGNGYTDMAWRAVLARDSLSMDRLRATDPDNTRIGGRLLLNSSSSTIGYQNTADTTQNTNVTTEANFAHVDNGRFQVTPPPSANVAILANAASGHTGYLIGAALAGVAKFTVDPSGNTGISGSLSSGRVTVAPAATSASALLVNAATGHTGNLLRCQLNSVDAFKVDANGSTTISGDLTVSGIGQRQTKRRTSDLSRTNTTTAASDTQITFTVDANAVYVIDGYLKYSGASDFLMGWTVPTGALGEWQGIGNGTTVISSTNANAIQQDITTSFGYTIRTESTDIASTRTYGGVGTTTFGVQVRGLLRIGATGGTFALAWAQGGSSATATILYTDSHIRLEKIG